MKIEVLGSAALMLELESIVRQADLAWASTAEFYKKTTPIDTGNARRNTTYSRASKTITSAYPYGARLDDGYSKQAPRGMVDPSLEYFESQLQRILR